MDHLQTDRYAQIRALISGNAFVMVTFVKKDGSIRKMLVQPAAGKDQIKGGSAAAQTRAARHPNLLNVWDVDRKAFRSINMDTVTRISAGGREYEFAPL